MLRSYTRKLTDSDDGARELLQNVSLTILSVPDCPVDATRFPAWARGVARHLAANQRRVQRRVSAVVSPDDELADAPAPDSDPEWHAHSRQKIANMVVAIDYSSIELLVRRYVLEEDVKELACELSQTPAAIRMRLMRLRAALRAKKGLNEKPPPAV
jgi:RNA polymerase sigma factor (sigma-70 family)